MAGCPPPVPGLSPLHRGGRQQLGEEAAAPFAAAPQCSSSGLRSFKMTTKILSNVL